MKQLLKKCLSVLLAIIIIFSSACLGFNGNALIGFFALGADIVSRGTCGENLMWVFDEGGTLTISGTGEMNNYSSYSSDTSAPWYGFRSDIETVVVDIGVTSIGSSAFESCNSLTTITIPDSVTSIGSNAFEYCNSLTTITIPDSVTSIGSNAFHCCNSLTTITIPDSVVNMGWYTFSYCENLKSVIIGNGLKSIGESNFIDCKSLESVVIGDSVESIGYMAFSGCRNLVSVSIGDSVKSIGSYAFYNCTSLVSIDFSDSLTSIGESAFAGCISLTHITILENVTSIGDFVFEFCMSLNSITIPGSVTSIGSSAFRCCTSLEYISVDFSNTVYKSVDGVLFDKKKSKLFKYPSKKVGSQYIIPDSVTDINDDAFSYNSNLTSITIPDSITFVGEEAFVGCNELKYVFYKGIESEWKNIVVDSGNELLTGATIHYNSTDHCYGEWIIDKAVSCFENGSMHKVCLYCDSSISETNYSTGHDYSIEWTVDIAPTCTGEGSKSHHCLNCNSKIDITVVEPTGHHYSDWVVTQNSTCTAAGERSKICSVCNDVIIESVTANGHIFSDQWIIDKTATCFSTGSKSHHCLNCDSKTDVTVIPIDFENHDYSDWDVEYTATCESSGKQVRRCRDCGKTEHKLIPATDHLYGDWQITKVGTCTEDGSKYKECINCGAKDTVIITAEGHKFSNNSCTVCGECMFTFEKNYDYDQKPYYVLSSCDTSAKGEIVIPDKYDGLPVKEIGRFAFQNCKKITAVTIPVSVIFMGAQPFLYCDNLSEVYYLGTLSQWELFHIGDGLMGARLYCCPEKPELKKIENTAEGVKISWGKIENAKSYNIYRKIKGGSYSKIGTTRKTYYTDKKAKNNTRYYYLIKAVNEVGVSASSNSKSIRGFFLKSAQNTSSGIKITWSRISGAKYYSVYRKDSDGSYSIIGLTSKTYYTDKSVKSGKKYYYYVIPFNKDNEINDYSSVISRYHLADSTLKAPTSTKSGVSLKWSKVTGAEGYVIYRKTGSGSYSKIATVKGNSKVTYIDKKAKKGKTYTYKIKAYKSKTTSAYSNAKKIKDKY